MAAASASGASPAPPLARPVRSVGLRGDNPRDTPPPAPGGGGPRAPHPAPAAPPHPAPSGREPEWVRLTADEPELASLFGNDAECTAWLEEAAAMLDRYFTLEDPRRIGPTHRELCVEAELASGLRLRGYIDRLGVAPGGQTRIVG